MVLEILYINLKKREMFLEFHPYKPKDRADSCTELCYQLQQSKSR